MGHEAGHASMFAKLQKFNYKYNLLQFPAEINIVAVKTNNFDYFSQNYDYKGHFLKKYQLKKIT